MAGQGGAEQVDLAASSDLHDLGRVVISLLRKWKLSEKQQSALLGTDKNEGAALSSHEIGAHPMQGKSEVRQRAEQLMAIHHSLRLLFPENEGLRFSWVARRNQAFGGSAPIDIMLRSGNEGIARVRALLDQQCMQ